MTSLHIPVPFAPHWPALCRLCQAWSKPYTKFQLCLEGSLPTLCMVSFCLWSPPRTAPPDHLPSRFQRHWPHRLSFSQYPGVLYYMKLPYLHITHLSVCFLFLFFFLRFYLFLDRGEGKEKERERNIDVWLPLMCPLLGTWPATQACALFGKQRATFWFTGWRSIHWATPARAVFFFLPLKGHFHEGRPCLFVTVPATEQHLQCRTPPHVQWRNACVEYIIITE